MAIRCVGKHDDIGFDLLQVRVFQLPSAHYTRGVVLYDDITYFHQLFEGLPPFILRKIKSQGTLTPIALVEGATTVKWVVAAIIVGLGIHGRRTVWMLDPLNFDHLSAQIGHDAAGIGHGDNVSRIYNANAFQWQFAHYCLLRIQAV